MVITIIATASGSLTPKTALFPETVTNGDFLIAGKGPDRPPLIGDGNNEITTWTFDFTRDPAFSFFSTELPLVSALLTLTLTPKNRLITTDRVRIEPLDGIITPAIQSLPIDETNTIHLELLSFPAFGYTSDTILDVLASDAGKIPMHYSDDAILSSAQLKLTQRALTFQYSVKFVCGKSDGEIMAPGVYFTAINVHNPTFKPIEFRKKVAIALPGEQPGRVSKFINAKLGPDEALEIDCPDIRKLTDSQEDFLKGFVVIETDVELDIVAVYTAASKDKQVETFHIEHVLPRRREVKRPDVKLPDLIPVPDPEPGIGFCKLDNQNRLIVTVKNQGDSDAPPSTTKVEFFPGGVVEIPTPLIPAGASVDLPPISFPAGCFVPDCHFKITVDWKNEIIESNKANNIASGFCLG
ncbi:MAG: hypothetical protein GWN62_23765 [Aliifodinibius sp.]|nr:hypothetical protein [Fodinibius sp.]